MQSAKGKIQATPVERGRVKIPQRHWIKAAHLDLFAGIGVAGGFRHFLPIGQQVLRVNPIIDELLAREAFALGNLIFMMGKYIVHSTGMHVKMLAQVFDRHGAALDMPPRKTRSPRTLPGHLAPLLSRFPQWKILRVMLICINPFAHTTQHVLKLIT